MVATTTLDDGDRRHAGQLHHTTTGVLRRSPSHRGLPPLAVHTLCRWTHTLRSCAQNIANETSCSKHRSGQIEPPRVSWIPRGIVFMQGCVQNFSFGLARRLHLVSGRGSEGVTRNRRSKMTKRGMGY